MHRIQVCANGKKATITLDGKELDGVTGFELKLYPNELAEIQIKMVAKLVDIGSEKSACDENEDDSSCDSGNPAEIVHAEWHAPRAIVAGFSQHDCESRYSCPLCNIVFGSWEIFNQEPNERGTKEYCPGCKRELRGLS